MDQKAKKKEKDFQQLVDDLERQEATSDIRVLLFGSSIVKHLHHPRDRSVVWDPILKKLALKNLGVGGDGAVETLQRLESTHFSEKHHRHLKV